jgi:hypothetical protein
MAHQAQPGVTAPSDLLPRIADVDGRIKLGRNDLRYKTQPSLFSTHANSWEVKENEDFLNLFWASDFTQLKSFLNELFFTFDIVLIDENEQKYKSILWY